jgi:hypothetical protein
LFEKVYEIYQFRINIYLGISFKCKQSRLFVYREIDYINRWFLSWNSRTTILNDFINESIRSIEEKILLNENKKPSLNGIVWISTPLSISFAKSEKWRKSKDLIFLFVNFRIHLIVSSWIGSYCIGLNVEDAK